MAAKWPTGLETLNIGDGCTIEKPGKGFWSALPEMKKEFKDRCRLRFLMRGDVVLGILYTFKRRLDAFYHPDANIN